MAEMRCKTFLYLQGPHGPFFSMLAEALRAQGHAALRININGGDKVDWPGEGAVDYRGTLSDWPLYFDDFVVNHGVTDLILYDAKTPEGALPGGMGVRFDWALLDGFRHPTAWALSGGLDASNVAEAARRTGAALVDASSGLETGPGVKNVDKIAAFLQAVASS